jgi:hypothetical protein
MQTALSIIGTIITLITAIVCVILVLGVILIVAEANPDNVIVENVVDGAEFLAGPFDTLFNLDMRKGEVAVNWVIATAVYAAVGLFVGGRLKAAGDAGRAKKD